MGNKIINIKDILDEKSRVDRSYTLDEIYEFTNKIEAKLNELYDFGNSSLENGYICSEEQLKIFTKICCSYFRICYAVLDNFNGSEEENDVLYNFAHDLDEISSSLPDIEDIKKRILNLDDNFKK